MKTSLEEPLAHVGSFTCNDAFGIRFRDAAEAVVDDRTHHHGDHSGLALRIKEPDHRGLLVMTLVKEGERMEKSWDVGRTWMMRINIVYWL